MGNQKTKEFQKQIADEFVSALNEEGLSWKKGWDSRGVPQNGASGYKYKGINALYLSLIQKKFNMQDPRWFTFVQIADKKETYHKGENWKLKKGSKGYSVEYAMPVKKGNDKENSKAISWKEFNELQKDPNFKPEDYYIGKRYTTVFNGSQIDGIKPYEKTVENKISPANLVEILSNKLEVEIFYNGGNDAYYSPYEDIIQLPEKSAFKNEAELNSTALHELAHSTGAEHRLNRESLIFYSRVMSHPDARPKEELIAEISSAMMSCHLSEELPNLENHKAYIQGWCSAINDDPSVLVNAIKQSEEATNYMEYKAGLITEEEYKKNRKNKIKQVKEENPSVDIGRGRERVESERPNKTQGSEPVKGKSVEGKSEKGR